MLDVALLMFGLLIAAIFAGMLGSLVGLGGGVLVVPLLTLGFDVSIQHAVAASIICVIATSNGAGAALVRDGLTNVRIATVLQVATSIGAITGAIIAPHVATKVLFLLFGCILLFSILPMFAKRKKEDVRHEYESDKWAIKLQMPGVYPDATKGGAMVGYEVTRVPLGFVMMLGAGVVSGLLGIGSGALKVLAMDTAMRLPIKVSSATSNFMIGVTAAASAGVYFWRGEVLPLVAAPIALGVLTGSFIGARMLVKYRSSTVRTVFMVLLVGVAGQMLLRGLGVI
jgi:uncharacterized membrane protein YfcA